MVSTIYRYSMSKKMGPRLLELARCQRNPGRGITQPRAFHFEHPFVKGTDWYFRCEMECNGAANLWPRPTGPVSFSGDFFNFLPRDVSLAVDIRSPSETKVGLSSSVRLTQPSERTLNNKRGNSLGDRPHKIIFGQVNNQLKVNKQLN